MAGTPFRKESATFTRSTVNYGRRVAGIDKGGSLTKIVIEESAKQVEDGAEVTLTFAVFNLDVDFEAVLDWIAEVADLSALSEENPLAMTGVAGRLLTPRTSEKLKAPVAFREEDKSHGMGLYFLRKHMDESKYLHDEIQSYESPFGSTHSVSEKFHSDEMFHRVKLCDENSAYFYSIAGSALGWWKVDETGDTLLVNAANEAGKYLIGASKLQTDIKEFDTILAKTLKGNLSNVSITDSDDAILYRLGKIDFDTNVKEISNDDKLCALLYHLIENVCIMTVLNCCAYGVKTVYMAGTWTSVEPVANTMQAMMKNLSKGHLNFRVLKTANTGALGAVLLNPKPTEETSV